MSRCVAAAGGGRERRSEQGGSALTAGSRCAILRAGGELAPRTIHNVYGDAHAMFRDAVVEELIESSPCVLPRGDLPPKVDKDP